MWNDSGKLSSIMPVHHYVTLKLNEVTDRMDCVFNKNEMPCAAWEKAKGAAMDQRSAEYEAWHLDSIIKAVKG